MVAGPNTETQVIQTSLGGNVAGTVLYGDQPGSTSAVVSVGTPETAVVVTGTPGSVSMEVKGDLLVKGEIVGNVVIDDGTFENIAVTVEATIEDLVVDGTADVTGLITATGGVAGDVTGNVTGDLTGNADTATTATTALNVTVSTVAALGAATAGGVKFASDAVPAAALVFADGTNWIDVLTGTTVVGP